MRKRRAVENRTEKDEKARPDCSVCIHRDGCALYAENSFCTRFQSSEPERYENPNDLWERGEEVDF